MHFAEPPRSVEAIDWDAWIPVDPATLLFVLPPGESRILLIRKKRGLGAGKINGPGGRIESGETPVQAAVREVEEEVGLVALDPVLVGDLRFQFVDGYSLHVHVFRSDSFHGELVETPEAIPLWTPLDAVPYDEMWADDRLWLPHLIVGRPFAGRFIFDGDEMVDHHLELTAG